MANIRRREGKRGTTYRVRYTGADGKDHIKTFKRKVDAERYAKTVEADVVRGDWVDPRLGRTAFGEWADAYLGSIRHVKPKTLQGYEGLLRAHLKPRFGSTEMAKIRPVDVRGFIADLIDSGVSPSLVRQARHLLGMIFNAAVENGVVSKSPVIGVKVPRVQRREMQPLTAEQVNRLAAATKPPYDVLIYVLSYAGLRWGEAAALRRGRCNMLRSRLEIEEALSEVGFDKATGRSCSKLTFLPTKTWERRSVYIPKFLIDMLARHLAENVPDDPQALVFTAPEGGPLRYNNFRRRIWSPAVKTADLPVRNLRIHDLRHTCAALLISSPERPSPKVIQDHLGHSSIQVTFDVYGHLFEADLDDLAAKLEL